MRDIMIKNETMRRSCVVLVAFVFVALAVHVSEVARAQDSSLYHRDLPRTVRPPLLLSDGSWIRPIPVLPREIKLHDVVSIRVDELARMQSDGEVNRRKNALYDALLLDWLTLNGLRRAKPDDQRDGDQRIRGQLNQLYRAENEMETNERLTFNIAARVADIRPNGNIVLEAHKEIRVNNEVWRASLTGICRQEDIGPDNVILSRNIIDLRIDKQELGHVRDSYKRGWITRFIDRFNPF